MTLNCLFGGWGRSRGTAWYDDVVLERVAGDLLAGGVGRAIPRVMRAYAARGPVDSVVSTLALLGEAPEALATSLLEGLVAGWPEGTAPAVDDADRAALAALARALGDEPRAHLATLLARWGVDGGAVIDVEALVASLSARIADSTAPTPSRIAAAERLVALQPDAAALGAILVTLAPNSEPELAAGLVRAVGASADAEVAMVLLDAWSRLGPQAQRAGVATLLRRDAWTRALLDRMVSGVLPASLIDVAQWSQVEQRAAGTDLATLVSRARGAAADPDRAAVVERFRGALTMPSDLVRGHAMYTQHCAKCHVLDGEGVPIGPELDGIGARAPEELLIAILDPNRSVEGTYQLWTARTKDGVIVAGRLMSETRTAIELVDADGESHLLARDELDLIAPSALSLMPAGLEAELGEQGLADLLAFLARRH